jgi:hypothetical protein
VSGNIPFCVGFRLLYTSAMGDYETNKSRSWLPNFLRTSTKDDTTPHERTSLLSGSQHEEWSAGETYELDDGAATKFQLVVAEFWILLRGSLPVVSSLDVYRQRHWRQLPFHTCSQWLPAGSLLSEARPRSIHSRPPALLEARTVMTLVSFSNARSLSSYCSIYRSLSCGFAPSPCSRHLVKKSTSRATQQGSFPCLLRVALGTSTSKL